MLKSGSVNLLEPSGPVQTSNGIALPLRLPLDRWLWCTGQPYDCVEKYVLSLPTVQHGNSKHNLVTKQTELYPLPWVMIIKS